MKPMKDLNINCPVFVTHDKFQTVIQILSEWEWKRQPSPVFSLHRATHQLLFWLNYATIPWSKLQNSITKSSSEFVLYLNHFQNAEYLSNKALLAQEWSPNSEKKTSFLNEETSFLPQTWCMQNAESFRHFFGTFLVQKAGGVLQNALENDKIFPIINQLKGALSILQSFVDQGNVQIDMWNSDVIEALLDAKQEDLGERITEEQVKTISEILQQWTDMDSRGQMNRSSQAWILKPVAQSCGKDITIHTTWEALWSHMVALHHQCIVQRYIERPMVLEGRKFDIRQWILVSDVNPVELWWHSECYLRCSAVPYSTQEWSSSEMHLCNHAVQKHTVSGNQDSAHLKQSKIKENMCSLNSFQDHLRCIGKEELWTEAIQPQMQNIVRQTVQVASSKMKRIGQAIEWLGFDFMIDVQFKVWLIEVNISPDVSHSTALTAKLVPPASEAALQVLLQNSKTWSLGEQMGPWELFFIGTPLPSIASKKVSTAGDLQQMHSHHIQSLSSIRL